MLACSLVSCDRILTGQLVSHIVFTPAHITCTPAHIACTPAHIACKVKVELKVVLSNSKFHEYKLKEKIPIAPIGVLAPGSAHNRPSARPPIDTSGIFTPHMSAESPSIISPNPSEVISEVSKP
jgi:hypothetical protein